MIAVPGVWGVAIETTAGKNEYVTRQRARLGGYGASLHT